MKFTEEDLLRAESRKDIIDIASAKKINLKKPIDHRNYEIELKELQSELVKLQKWIVKKKLRVAIIFEGRDAAGKGGAIKRFKEHLIPRSMRVVALTKPTEDEQGQWYFRRYIKELPNPGEIILFDRSWYNRGVVEPVMDFCNEQQYDQFMAQVTELEHMLYEDGIVLIKFWFSISQEEQKKRIFARRNNPVKRWKFSAIDEKGLKLWDAYTHYRELMFNKTHSDFSPWIIVKTNDKKIARLESIRYVLSKFDYDGKNDSKVSLFINPNVVSRYYRKTKSLGI